MNAKATAEQALGMTALMLTVKQLRAAESDLKSDLELAQAQLHEVSMVFGTMNRLMNILTNEMLDCFTADDKSYWAAYDLTTILKTLVTRGAEVIAGPSEEDESKRAVRA